MLLKAPLSSAVAESRWEEPRVTAALKQEAGTNKWKEKLKTTEQLSYKAGELRAIRGGNVKNDCVVIEQLTYFAPSQSNAVCWW